MIQGAVKLLLKAAAINAVRKQGELIYYKAVDAIRKSLRFVFLLVLLTQLMVVGLGLTVYSTFQLIPMDETQRLYGMLILGVILLIVPLALVLWGTSDRLWFKASKHD
jgi:uncharacterized membrane protein YqjE